MVLSTGKRLRPEAWPRPLEGPYPRSGPDGGIQHVLAFCGLKGARMLGAQGYPALVSLRAAGTIKRSPRDPQGLTGGSNSLFKCEVRGGGHQSFPSSSGRLRGILRSSGFFFEIL